MKKTPLFLSRRVRLKTNEAAKVKLRLKNYNEISNNKQTCIVSNPNSERSFSITKIGLYVLLNTQSRSGIWGTHWR